MQQTLVPYQHHAHYTDTASIFILNKSFITRYYISSLLQQQFEQKREHMGREQILSEKRYIALKTDIFIKRAHAMR